MERRPSGNLHLANVMTVIYLLLLILCLVVLLAQPAAAQRAAARGGGGAKQKPRPGTSGRARAGAGRARAQAESESSEDAAEVAEDVVVERAEDVQETRPRVRGGAGGAKQGGGKRAGVLAEGGQARRKRGQGQGRARAGEEVEDRRR